MYVSRDTFAFLACVEAGDKFTFNGRACIAYSDARVSVNKWTLERQVSITAGRAHASMPSGYEAADIWQTLADDRIGGCTADERRARRAIAA